MIKDYLADVPAEHLPTARRIIELHERFISEFDPFNLQEYTQWAEEELRLAQEIEWAYGLVHAHFDMASGASTQGNYVGAITSLRSALTHARELDDLTITCRVLIELARQHLHMAEYEEALEYSQAALDLVFEESNAEAYIQAHITMAGACFGLTEYDRAVELGMKARELARTHDFWMLETNALNVLGMICDRMEDFRQTIIFFEANLKLYEDHSADAPLCSACLNLGKGLFSDGQIQRGTEYAERGIRIAQQLGNRALEATGLHILGAALEQQGDLDGARLYYERCYQTFLSMGKREHAAGMLLSIGDLERERGNLPDAIKLYRQLIETITEPDARHEILEAHECLYEALKESGDAIGALEHLEQWVALDSKMFTEESEKKLQEMKVRYELDKAQSQTEIERLRAEQLQYQLDTRQRELAATAMSLARQSELLGRFRNELRQIVRDDIDPAAGIRAIREKLRELPSETIDWSKFEAEFQQAYPEFRTKLEEKYPVLTKMEVRICSLVKMRLASLDISQLLNLSERTVETHRLNLRRKMGLGKRADLYEALARL